MNIEKEREALVAEIELFIAEAMKTYVVERWADSYQRTEPFAYTIYDKSEVWWMKTQAHQLWQFWKAAKAHESEQLEGCVVVPVESLRVAMKWMHEDINAAYVSNEGFMELFNHKPTLEKILKDAEGQ